jgi:hypothetical protein
VLLLFNKADKAGKASCSEVSGFMGQQTNYHILTQYSENLPKYKDQFSRKQVSILNNILYNI